MHRRRMVTAALAVVATVAAVWAVSSMEHEVATCDTTVDFRGVSYTTAEAAEEIVSADELGTGEEHGCGHMGPYSNVIAINSIPGVDPRRAVASPVSAHTVYLAPGVKPQELPQKFGTVKLSGTP